MEQAPQHPWQWSPRWPPPEQPPWWRWGWKKALGWEQWKRRSAEEGQTIAQPQHLYNPSLRTPVPPGLPMEGQTTAGKGPERRRPPPPETRRPGRRSPPPAPLWSAYDHQYERRKRSASRTACHAEKISQQGNPRRAASHMTPSGKTAGVPRLAEETHQGGSARADNTRSRRRKKKIQHRCYRKEFPQGKHNRGHQRRWAAALTPKARH